MVGALFGAWGQTRLHHGGGDYPPIGFSGKVKLFKHIHESLKYIRFDTKLS